MTDKTRIEEAIRDENRVNFSQTNNTPSMKEPLVSELGFLGDNQSEKETLKGTYIPPENIDIY